MKMIKYCSILLLLIVNLVAATSGKITKIRKNLVLIECTGTVSNENKMVTIKRQSGDDILEVGTAEIIKIRGKQAVAKIIAENDGMTISTGDFIGDTPVSGFDASDLYDMNTGNGNCPIDRMLTQAWPTYQDSRNLSVNPLDKMLNAVTYQQ